MSLKNTFLEGNGKLTNNIYKISWLPAEKGVLQTDAESKHIKKGVFPMQEKGEGDEDRHEERGDAIKSQRPSAKELQHLAAASQSWGWLGLTYRSPP